MQTAVPRRHCAVVKAGDRSPCVRGKSIPWVLPRCNDGRALGKSRSFHRRARPSPLLSPCSTEGKPKAYALTVPVVETSLPWREEGDGERWSM